MRAQAHDRTERELQSTYRCVHCRSRVPAGAVEAARADRVSSQLCLEPAKFEIDETKPATEMHDNTANEATSHTRRAEGADLLVHCGRPHQWPVIVLHWCVLNDSAEKSAKQHVTM